MNNDISIVSVAGLVAIAVALAFINMWALLGYGIALVAFEEAVDYIAEHKRESA